MEHHSEHHSQQRPEHHVEWVCSPDVLARAGRALWWRRYAGSWALYLGVRSLVLVLCMASREFTSSRVGWGVMGFFAGVVGTLPLMGAYQFASMDQS